MRVSLQDVQKNLSVIANRPQYDFDIVYDILLAYGKPQATISKLKSGSVNRALDDNGVALKNYLYWQVFSRGTNLAMELDGLKKKNAESKCSARYLVATDLDDLAAIDLDNNGASGEGTLIIKLRDIDRHSAFFYGLTGNKVAESSDESPTDRQAAEKMNELYAEIERVNLGKLQNDPSFLHGLNVFFTRLLFCFFSEDTGIFGDKQFTNAVKDYTNPDGSDLDWFLNEVFHSLDTIGDDKDALSSPFNSFPYVNGTIFDSSRHDIVVPKFNAQARHLLLQCGARDWSDINPDIFGTMFQGIVDPQKRSENGMDYTSVPNIMRVIQPLFLDDLNDEFEKAQGNEQKLWALLERISKIKIFDPACGSGNFLIISFKQLRLLQHQILEQIDAIRPSGLLRNSLKESQLIGINNFYGIEIDDFAHELAVLSLHIAHQQMNIEFSKQFGIAFPIIPLIDAPHIVCANAARIDWQAVCPNKPNLSNKPTISGTMSLLDNQMPDNSMSIEQVADYDEIYLIGNPPYKGAKLQTKEQKADLQSIFSPDEKYSKNLDYISIWFIKGSRYISGTKAKLAFVSTNSICQGEHVSALFPKLYENNVEISFAYTSFKWRNSARGNAGVYVVIVGLSNVRPNSRKLLISDDVAYDVGHISPYLTEGGDKIVTKERAPISGFKPMVFGCMPRSTDLILASNEAERIMRLYPKSRRFMRRYIGAEELVGGSRRFCIWVNDGEYGEAMSIDPLKKIFANVRDQRTKSAADSTRRFADQPYKFVQISNEDDPCLVIPRVTTSERDYVPIGIFDSNVIVADSCFVVYYGDSIWLLSLLESRMHTAWISVVCGRLGMGFRYSNTLGYNTFPVPELTDDIKSKLNQSARNILFARENHSENTLAELYDPEKMPDDLRHAHMQNDLLVDSLYKTTRFRNDEERLSRLFEMYEQMTK